MNHLPYCLQCKKQCKKVAYAMRGIGFLCEKDWIQEIKKQEKTVDKTI